MKKVLFVLMVVALLLTSFTYAEYRPATASPTPVPKGVIHGNVADALDPSKKLGDVLVTTGIDTTRTDAQGNYTLNLMPGEYTVKYTKEKYTTVEKNVTVLPAQVTEQNCHMVMEQGTVYGFAANAADPTQKLAGVKVTCGNDSVLTDARGNYSIGLRTGENTLFFTLDGFNTVEETVRVEAGARKEKNCYMSRTLDSNEFRVVLEWGLIPPDLDSHLYVTGSIGETYHVSYSDRVPEAAEGKANLDVDDVTSYGPETLTFTIDADKTYVYYIHDFTNRENMNSPQLADSRATVRVEQGNRTLQTYSVPQGIGIYWEVFRIENGNYETVNEIKQNRPQ